MDNCNWVNDLTNDASKNVIQTETIKTSMRDTPTHASHIIHPEQSRRNPPRHLYVPYATLLWLALGLAVFHIPGMNPKTEELLYFLLWSADSLMRPTFRNLTDSFEAWAFRNRLLRRLQALEAKQLIESDASYPNDRLFRLTEEGRRLALGGRDPLERWARHWDGKWRLVLFDVPQVRSSQRTQLRRYLRSKGFGYLQNSVWVSPDPLQQERQTLAGGRINVESLLLLEARPCAGERDEDIVEGAWDFDQINRSYSKHIKLLEQRPQAALRSPDAVTAFQQWAGEERTAWLSAVSLDPLLPERLLPKGYLGQRAWRLRVQILRLAAKQIQSFGA